MELENQDVLCQHEGCQALGFTMWDFYAKVYRSYCQGHMAEHGFCWNCLSNLYPVTESGCLGCEQAREKGVGDV